MEFGRVPYAAVIAIAAVIVVVYAYMRVGPELARRDRVALTALRVAGVLLLAFCLMAPTRVVTRMEAVRSQVVLLVDRSASMSVADSAGADGDEPRWDVAVRAAESLDQELGYRFDVRRYTFDASLHSSRAGDYGAPEGSATDILSAVSAAIERTRGAPVSGVVVLSDGGQNVGTLSLADSYGAPVYSLAVGDPDPPKDLAVTRVGADPYVFMGERATVRATVRTSGYAGSAVAVSLSDGRSLIATTTVEAGQDGDIDVSLPFTPESEGTFRYRVSVSRLVGELTESNNERALTVQVLPSRIRVLLVDATPRHEFAFLRRTLERLESVELTPMLLAMPTVSRASDSLPARRGDFPIGSASTELPASPEALVRYDVVLIGDVPLAMLTAAQRNALTDFVRRRGKGIAWLAGENWLSRRLGVGALEELLPASVPTSGARVLGSEFAPVLSREGRFHAVTHLGTSLEENRRIWSRMPLWTRPYVGLTPKAGATVLVSSSSGGEPMVLYSRAGLGKSLLVATDATWQWGFGSALLGEDVAQREVYSRFWSQTVRWLARPSNAKQVTVSLGDGQPVTGQTLEVGLRAYDAGLLSAADAAVQLTVRYPDGHTAPVPVTPSDSAPGSFHAFVPLTHEGTHELRAVATVRGVASQSDPVRFDVEAPRLEFAQVARNDGLLASLAENSGGIFAIVEEWRSVAPLLAEHGESREVRERRAVWTHPLIFIGLVALLTAEWAQRKRKGLV